MNRIAELRKKCGLSQSELAAQIGIAQNTLSQYETNARTPKHDTILKISSALGVPASYLAGVTNDQGTTDIGLTAITLSEITGIDSLCLYDTIIEMMDSDHIDPRNAFSDNDLLDAIKAKARHLELRRNFAKQRFEELKEYLSQSAAEQDSSCTLVISPDLQANRTAMFDLFKRLNEHGQKEALKRIEELTELPRYQNKLSTPEDK